MDIQGLVKTIDEVSRTFYPEVPEIAKLCEAIIRWERDNASILTPRYKEPFNTFLKGVGKRWQDRLEREKLEETK